MKLHCAIVVCLLAFPQVAHAAAPLVTDDADVIDAKSCQLEAWIDTARDGHEGWLVPACNFTGNLELAVGAGAIRPDSQPFSNQLQFQAKTVIARGAQKTWSTGLVAGVARDSGPVASDASSRAWYAKGLLSIFPREDLEIDINLGASNDFGAGATAVAGIAVQYEFVERATLMAEIFRDERGPGKFQVAANYAFIPDRFVAYISYGNRLGSTGNAWWSIAGIRINTAAFLP